MNEGVILKKILFITGTRADYGKIKSLIKKLDQDPDFEVYIYVSGMHLITKYGATYKEVLKDNFKNVYVAFGQQYTSSMSFNLGNIISNLTGYVQSINPDMICVHGDRSDALAGAIVGALSNIIVAHIEGGEISGTIDDSIRHAITKFAHLHFVSNGEAKKRLEQLGEDKKNIYVIGSPDIDIMKSNRLPSIEFAKKYYEIDFEQYAFFMYHPVTTEYEVVGKHIREVVNALIESKHNYIVVYPNNDLGTEVILDELKRLENNERFRIFPSLRFESFLTLLKNAEFVIGNSSAGIRETGIYGVPSIDVGTRQEGRYDIAHLKNLQHVDENTEEVLKAIEQVESFRIANEVFGDGNSTEKFLNVLRKQETWECEIQKKFIDIEIND